MVFILLRADLFIVLKRKRHKLVKLAGDFNARRADELKSPNQALGPLFISTHSFIASLLIHLSFQQSSFLLQITPINILSALLAIPAFITIKTFLAKKI